MAPSVPTPRRVLELTDRYMAEGRNTLTAYDASEGSLFVLFAMVVGLHPGVAPVVAVDNVDHGLNPRLARALQNIDALIDQIDGEAAADAEIAVVQPCPPPEATADALRRVVEGWLGADLPHRRVVIAVPSMETEAWLLPSLRPGLAFHHCVERFCEIPPHVAERVAWPREGLWTAPELLTQCRAPAPGKSRNREKAA